MTETSSGLAWRNRPHHRAWLVQQAMTIFEQFQSAVIDPAGGFFSLDDQARPRRDDPVRELLTSARLVHSFSIAQMMGQPGAANIVDHGMDALWNLHRDQSTGGYPWETRGSNTSRQAYGHAFVLLAASSAKMAGHPDADRLIADVTGIMVDKFWDPDLGAMAEEFDADWRPLSNYRGQNANMHSVEAFMGAFEATGDSNYLGMAERIATRLIHHVARSHDWHVIEHFDRHWVPDTVYRGSDMFRPFGTTPGHSLQWSRQIAQLDALGSGRLGWTMDAARCLFKQAITDGWDKDQGGFYYTLDYDNQPLIRDRLWWPVCEAIAASAYLHVRTEDAVFETWYRKVWDWADRYMLDHRIGGWHGELNDRLVPHSRFFSGKTDIYHALHACLVPLLPARGGLAAMTKMAASPTVG
ncbi:AGE family epimerase/isomerase [Acidisoma cellulosilytica]|uniref:AGE family epimerase/isomerase n=1 Tax=Acidisoma cellulosilyticum TaxID=2802395 RepID=A0A964E6L8_9PROT|nr:AGE family epimerase/isomerase [Acidisoma cellulosilyticum]MCB8883143.1 AGE family epimerase/isomerase [Acidisoma cellulosilyticum]